MWKEHFHEYGEQKTQQGTINKIKPQMRGISNLNSAFIPDDMGSIYCDMQDYSTTGSDEKIQVFFKNLEDHLIRFLQDADVVLGCVAWLTSESVLKTLSSRVGVSIIVQKEDFLRPDFQAPDGWSYRLRQLYDGLPKRLDWRYFPEPLGNLTFETEPLLDPIRCVGNHNVEKRPASPRSHHKFVIFCKAMEHCICKQCQQQRKWFLEWAGVDPYDCKYCTKYLDNMLHIQPYAVWTGSFNFTRNAVMSFENALVLYDANVVNAFYNEYLQIAVLSEPLNWTTPWISPEWHIKAWT